MQPFTARSASVLGAQRRNETSESGTEREIKTDRGMTMIISAHDHAELVRLDEIGMKRVLRGFDGILWAYAPDGRGVKLPPTAIECIAPWDDPIVIRKAIMAYERGAGNGTDTPKPI